MENLDILLNDISELKEQKEKENRDKDSYNVFDSIGFKNQEVMHSKFIAHLLNPKASHGAKKLYLNLFLAIAKIPDFNSDNVTVKIEKPAGKRRIDIALENHKSAIIIENKIWAQDQDKQLEDYYRWCKEKEEIEKVTVVYLTPYGNVPSDCSLGEKIKKEKVICISYEKTIIPWIIKCAKSSEGRVKTSLDMYVETVEILINRDRYMNEIFEHLKKDKKKLELALGINSALQGRDFVKEFPELKEALRIHFNDAIYASTEEDDDEEIINIYPLYDHLPPKIGIEHPDPNIDGWEIIFGEGEVFAEKDGKIIPIFNPTDINSERIKSLIFNETEKIDEWINKLIEDMKGSKLN